MRVESYSGTTTGSTSDSGDDNETADPEFITSSILVTVEARSPLYGLLDVEHTCQQAHDIGRRNMPTLWIAGVCQPTAASRQQYVLSEV